MGVILGNELLASIVAQVLKCFESERDHLNSLDAVTGDGDHGLSMVAGLRALDEYLKKAPSGTGSELLREGGDVFNQAAGSTIGVLMLAALKGAAKVVEGVDDVELADASRMFDAAIAAM